MPLIMSEKQKKYFDKIEKDVYGIYDFANNARKNGKCDPALEVECPPAMDMAGRVEKLVGPDGIGDILREWIEAGSGQDENCFRAMDWILEGKFGKRDENAAVDLAIRVALAIKTEGVVSAPLEGIGRIVIRDNLLGGPKYLSLYFAGPIRAAGGTVQAFAVLCADYVRNKMGIAPWIPTDDEVARYVEEIKLYDRIMHLQYPSTVEELAFAVKHLTVELNGDPTEDQEVSAHRDLPRMETNFVRGGPCLVINDGVLLKSKKIMKTIDKLKIPGWDWLKELKKLGQAEVPKKEPESDKDKQLDYGGDTYKGNKTREDGEQKTVHKEDVVLKRRRELDLKNPPLDKFVADIIAGRPVFGYPSRIGGHRIRYGRSRNTGLAACGMHPSQMIMLEKFCAVGTQIRIERPGKSGSTMPVTSIEPPIVLLDTGEVKQIWDIKDAKDIADKRRAKKILFVGDMLFGFGEFAENNHTIIPSGYVEEWWAVELEEKIKITPDLLQNLPDSVTEAQIKDFIQFPFDLIPSGLQALEIAAHFKIGIHPRYLDHWGNISGTELLIIQEAFINALENHFHLIQWDSDHHPIPITVAWMQLFGSFAEGFPLNNEPNLKKALENAYVVHKLNDDTIIIEQNRALIFLELLGLGKSRQSSLNWTKIKEEVENMVALDVFPNFTTLKVPDKAPYYMGSRMGRPEKAKERKMKPPVHVLFPLSHDSELQLSVQAAAAAPAIEVEVCQKRCPDCATITFLNRCPKCQQHTEFLRICHQCKSMYSQSTLKCPKCQTDLGYFSPKKIPLKKYFDEAASHIPKTIPIVKGVKGMSSEFKSPEPLEKGILRAINEVWVYKDGTARADAIDVPVTHFTCKEITVSVDKIKELGYDLDIYGQPITSETQVIELKVQDVLLNHHLGDYFVRVANFVDDELEFIYKTNRFYKVKQREDLIGHYMVGLAPHTSAGIIGRLIGFNLAECGYAHPFWQAAKRRNCFPSNTDILIELNQQIQRISIEELYHLYHLKNDELKVYSFDREKKKVVPTKILEVNRIQSPNNLIEFELKSGRRFSTTIDHPVVVLRDHQYIEIKAVEVLKSDKFLLPELKLPSEDFEKFDLIKEFDSSQFKQYWEDLMIRDIKSFTKSLVENLGGLAMAANRLNMNKKNLFNYYSTRDSIPFSILKQLLLLNQKSIDDLPDCTLGFKRDDTFVPRYIPNNVDLMKLLGYYISEGFYRSGDRCYQIDIAAHEEDIRQDILQTIQQVFGYGFNPYVDDYRITISSRVLYYFFKDIMKFSNTARTKRVPSWINKLPLNKITSLLSAYFSGDGGVDKARLNVTCTSYSRELIRDLDFLLLRLGIFSNLSEQQRDTAIEYKLRIVGENTLLYSDLIGFYSKRKSQELSNILNEINAKERNIWYGHRMMSIRAINPKPAESEYVYTLNAEKYHTVLINEHIMTHQCDGDEDGIMLLLDCLLNFSRAYLPAKLGGKMDAPLVISVRLDPREVDGESHNVDYAAKYPLQFYEDSLKYAKPGDVEKYMVLYKKKLGTEGQFEGCMFTHPTVSINYGPHKSAYTVFETMGDKIESQLWLAKTITAVDSQDVARKVISSHFTPDILGNIRSFSTQSFRCPKCGAKYRRVPLMGKCVACGGKLLMTVTSGGITKYLDKAIKMIDEFELSSYMAQRFQLIAMNVISLTNNPRIKQKSISSFFR